MNGEVQVLIVADNPLARTGLAALLDEQGGCRIVGRIASEQLNNIDIYNPDVVVWDVGASSTVSDVGYPVVALIPDLEQSNAVWNTQPQALLLRSVGTEALLAAVMAVAQGLIVLDPELAAVLVPPQRNFPELAEDLTPRELEVLQLLAEGLSNRAIALALAISEHTVKFHVNAIMTKLDAQSRTEAAVRATRLGLIIV